MAFVNDFLKSLAIPVCDLADWLEKDHNIPIIETIKKWNEITGMKVTTDKNCKEVVDQTVSVVRSNQKSASSNLNQCQHVFLVGNRKGQQCSTKPKGGNNKCCAHKTKPKKTDANRSDSDASRPQSAEGRRVEGRDKRFKKKTLSKSECDDSESDAEKQLPQITKKTEKKIPLSSSDSDTDDEEKKVVLPSKKKKEVIKKKVPPTSGSEID
jgi:hypothetical protein